MARPCLRCDKGNDSPSGPYCRACRATYMRDRYREDPAAGRARTREWRERNPDKRVAIDRRNHLRKMGVTPEWYESTLAAQGGRCAICRAPEGCDGRKSLSIDHDHSCCPPRTSCENCRRGLICHGCNLALGSMADDPDRLVAAATYLREWRPAVLPDIH